MVPRVLRERGRAARRPADRARRGRRGAASGATSTARTIKWNVVFCRRHVSVQHEHLASAPRQSARRAASCARQQKNAAEHPTQPVKSLRRGADRRPEQGAQRERSPAWRARAAETGSDTSHRSAFEEGCGRGRSGRRGGTTRAAARSARAAIGIDHCRGAEIHCQHPTGSPQKKIGSPLVVASAGASVTPKTRLAVQNVTSRKGQRRPSPR